MTDHPSIAFIGLGRMGRPMAANLVKAGHRLVLCDLFPDIAKELAASWNCRAVSTVAEVGPVSTIITMLPDSAAVHQVILGSGGTSGLADSAAPGSVFIDMSSSAPAATRTLADELKRRSLHLIDAPVSGGVAKAEAGTLAIMTGGDEERIAAVSPLLLAMGAKLFYTGPVGTAHAMKALNNYVSAAGLAAASEAVRIGSAFGIEPATMIDILNASTGRNNSTENKFHQFILSNTFASGFSLALMAKDVGLADDLASLTNEAAPLLERCAKLWRQAAASLGPAADHTAYHRFRSG